jgi:small neutral amino acid transporter SnatA (MarC family)
MAYVNYTLDEFITTPIALMIAMVIIWILFYLGGQVGKERGKEQMNILYEFMEEVISESSRK